MLLFQMDNQLVIEETRRNFRDNLDPWYQRSNANRRPPQPPPREARPWCLQRLTVPVPRRPAARAQDPQTTTTEASGRQG